MRAYLICALVFALTPAAWARQGPEPRRPRLERSADPNDWESYYDHALDRLRSRPSDADDAFEWARRLGPNRAEPLYGRWVTFWLRNVNVFEAYLDGTRSVPGAADADSLRARALWRNPLLPPTLEVLIYDQLPGEWGDSPLARGLLFCRG